MTLLVWGSLSGLEWVSSDLVPNKFIATLHSLNLKEKNNPIIQRQARVPFTAEASATLSFKGQPINKVVQDVGYLFF